MQLGEKALIKFCYPPELVSKTFIEDTPDQLEFRHIDEEIKDLSEFIRGASVVDFGSGYGHQAMALHKRFNCRVLGLEIEDGKLAYSKSKCAQIGIDEAKVCFRNAPRKRDFGKHDLVLSLNSFEHFNNPDEILVQMKRLLAPGGKILISFGPPWYAPYGSHMNYFCKIPWVNLLFSEDTIMRVRSRFRDDGATRFEEVPGGLSRMSVAKFESLMRKHNLKFIHRRYHGIKGVNFLTKIPFLRELCVNKITVVVQA